MGETSFRGRGRGRVSQTENLTRSDRRLCHHHDSDVQETDLFTNEMNGRSHIVIMRGVYDENKSTNSSERVIPVDINQNVEKFADMNLGDAKDELPSSSGSFITCASFKGSDEQREVLIQ